MQLQVFLMQVQLNVYCGIVKNVQYFDGIVKNLRERFFDAGTAKSQVRLLQ